LNKIPKIPLSLGGEGLGVRDFEDFNNEE